jgi:hypothetical protein
MMGTQSKRELVTSISPRYVTATGADKARILDEFVATTGYHRKYAITLLRHPPAPRRHPITRPRAKRYTPAVQRTLVRLWEVAGRICSKRLVPGLPDLLGALERHGELTLDASARDLLCALSAATADRLLAPARRAALPRGRTTTKPGSLLKHQIPIRTFADWDDARPGFFEIDLVAHGGDSSSGEYLHSLVLTDIATQWTECIALKNRGEQAVSTAIAHARTLIPVPVLGLDSDNGGEFINHLLFRYCERERITFTRCRPHKKNDQCHVEQKSDAIVRQIVGYDRYEGEEAYRALGALDLPVRRSTNFFQPSMRLVSKQREGAKVTKRHGLAQTPCQRMLASKGVTDEGEARPRDEYRTLNPAAIHQEIEAAQAALRRQAGVRSTREATTLPE